MRKTAVMDTQTWLEILGYAASVLVAASLMMNRIVRLRVVNLAGSLAFSIYGLLIGALPVAAVNAFIACVNIYYLHQLAGRKECFQILPVPMDSPYLQAFLKFHAEDITRFQPEYSAMPQAQIAVLILRDLIPAGVILGLNKSPGVLEVCLDYVIPSYRDFKTGRFLFRDNASFLRKEGITRVETRASRPAHRRYLQRMGFTPSASSEEIWILPIT